MGISLQSIFNCKAICNTKPLHVLSIFSKCKVSIFVQYKFWACKRNFTWRRFFHAPKSYVIIDSYWNRSWIGPIPWNQRVQYLLLIWEYFEKRSSNFGGFTVILKTFTHVHQNIIPCSCSLSSFLDTAIKTNKLTLCVPMKFLIKFDMVKSGWSIVNIEGSQIMISKKLYFFFWRFILPNSER